MQNIRHLLLRQVAILSQVTNTPIHHHLPPQSQYTSQQNAVFRYTAKCSIDILLQYAGEAMSPATFIDNHLTCDNGFYRKGLFLYGPDPYRVFVGNPRTKASYGCMAPVIEAALIDYFGDSLRVINTTGTDITTLCRRYIDRGIPVILWATSDMTPIKTGSRWRLEDGRLFTWPSGEHCLLLVGYNEDSYFFNDPKYGLTLPYPKAVTQQRYAEMGQQSLVIE